MRSNEYLYRYRPATRILNWLYVKPKPDVLLSIAGFETALSRNYIVNFIKCITRSLNLVIFLNLD